LHRIQPRFLGGLGVVVVVTVVGGTVSKVVGGILAVVGTMGIGTSVVPVTGKEGDDAAGGVPASPRIAPLALPRPGGTVDGTGRVVAVCGMVAGRVVGATGGVLVLVLALVAGTSEDAGGTRAERAAGPISSIVTAMVAPVK
jgi:hypothetical protein